MNNYLIYKLDQCWLVPRLRRWNSTIILGGTDNKGVDTLNAQMREIYLDLNVYKVAKLIYAPSEKYCRSYNTWFYVEH